jgi:hypothetical protein
MSPVLSEFVLTLPREPANDSLETASELSQDPYRLVTEKHGVQPIVRVASMTMKPIPQRPATRHRHRSVTLHVLAQRQGIPYELEQKVCSSCSRILEERPLKRAAA